MRTTGLFTCLFLIACGNSGSSPMGGDDAPEPDANTTENPPPPARGFQIVTPDIEILAGQEVTYCYYFRTPNTESMAIKKWSSEMTPGSHHLILFTTGNTDKMPPGTVSAANCGFGLNASWTYSAQTPTAAIELPSDDGAGNPLAMEIPPNTAGFVQMHYFNPGDQAIKAHVTINADALPADAPFTKTAAFITYNNSINVPMNAVNDVESQSCNVPSTAKFWLMSTHAHARAIKTEVLDGQNAVFTSHDWEHPGAETWMTAPFYTFASGKITYRCTYNNPSMKTFTSGDSASDNEMCMASGYFFPATKPLFCFDGNGPF